MIEATSSLGVSCCEPWAVETLWHKAGLEPTCKQSCLNFFFILNADDYVFSFSLHLCCAKTRANAYVQYTALHRSSPGRAAAALSPAVQAAARCAVRLQLLLRVGTSAGAERDGAPSCRPLGAVPGGAGPGGGGARSYRGLAKAGGDRGCIGAVWKGSLSPGAVA